MTAEQALWLTWAYVIILVATAYYVKASEAYLRTAVALIANLAAVWFTKEITGRYDAWWFFLAVDGLTARVVLRQPAGRWQAIVGFLLILQCVLHVRYGISISRLGHAGDDSASVYLDTLTALGWGQLVALIGGATHGRWRHINRGHTSGCDYRTVAKNGGGGLGAS